MLCSLSLYAQSLGVIPDTPTPNTHMQNSHRVLSLLPLKYICQSDLVF